jgi:hypothetical protein
MSVGKIFPIVLSLIENINIIEKKFENLGNKEKK